LWPRDLNQPRIQVQLKIQGFPNFIP